MGIERIGPGQYTIVGASVARSLRYVGRLRDRLTQNGVVPGDPYYQLVEEAFNALHALRVETHYRSCTSGVGQRQR